MVKKSKQTEGPIKRERKYIKERARKSDRENRKEEKKGRRTKIERYAFTNERKRRKKSKKSMKGRQSVFSK
jgi:hypothetical protein